MTYTYQVIETGQEIEIDHPMSQPALTEIERDGVKMTVKRLIQGGGSGFILKGDGWARTGYERGIQSNDYVKKYGDKETRGY